MGQMMGDSNAGRKPMIAAAVAVGLVLLAYGLSYRVLAAHLAAPGNSVPFDQAAVQRLPMQIGDWTGAEAPLNEDVVRATDTDAHLSRRYSRNGLGGVSLYIACGVRARDLLSHRPEVCYTGAGWTVMSRAALDLSLADGVQLPCSVFQFSRGALSTEKVIVLYYYIVDGQYCGDVSLLRSKAWLGSGTVRYVAQVQVVSPVTVAVASDPPDKLVCAFAVESAPWITRLFEESTEGESTEGSSGPPREETAGDTKL